MLHYFFGIGWNVLFIDDTDIRGRQIKLRSKKKCAGIIFINAYKCKMYVCINLTTMVPNSFGVKLIPFSTSYAGWDV